MDESATWDRVVQYLLANGLLRFRIPILFAISGYLFAFREDGRTLHRTRVLRRARTLGVPYLAWSAIAIALTFALEQWSVTRGYVASAQLSPFQPEANFVGQYSWSQLTSRWLSEPAAFQLWFLRALLLLTALYPWLRTAVLRWPRTFFSIATIYWLAPGGLPFLDNEGLLFYALGVWLAVRDVNIAVTPPWVRVRLFGALWLLLCAIRTWMAFTFHDLNTPIFVAMLLLYHAAEIFGLLTAWYGFDSVAQRAMQQSWFRWLTNFSFIIYALHVPLLNYATEASLSLGASVPLISFWTYLFVPVAICATAVLGGATLRRVAPPVYAVLTGGRGL
jgi:fucose 4-O-acetylase-like acetyltransferase